MIRKILLCTAVLAVAAASSSMAYTSADLLFSVNHNDLGASGSTIDTWGIFSKTGATGYVPTVETLTNATTGIAVNWAKQAPSLLNPTTGATTGGGSGLTSGIVSSIENTGFTIVSAVRANRVSPTNGDMRSVVNLYSGALGLYVKDTGTVALRLQTGYNTYNTFNSTKTIAEGTPIVLSMVVSSTGVYSVYAGAELFLSGTSSNWPTTGILMPNINPIGTSTVAKNSFGLGSAGGIVTGSNSSAFRGYIGDTYVYKTALTDDERKALVSTVETSMGMVAVPEPAGVLAMLMGLGSLVGLSRRRR